MKKLFLCMALGLAAEWALAAEPLWLRDVKISPDGQQIAFCYKGDIYKVAADGGKAVQLTTQESYESSPVWSPDGTRIAFASNREGGSDLYVMSSEGGPARRITFNSASEVPTAFSPDGEYVLFVASIQDPAASALFPKSSMPELYRVPVGGGRVEQVLGTPAEAVCFGRDGSFFLYQDRKGGEDEWRKHHTSSITRDIWLYRPADGSHVNLTQRAGEDRNPVLSPDGAQVYFLSERDGGSFNVYSFPLDNPAEVTAVTHFRTHPVRFLSVGDNGTLCYAYNGEIYTQPAGGKPRKVVIDLTRDDAGQETIFHFTSGASDPAVSPDGKQIAFTVRGELFVTSVEYGTTKRVTETAATESDVTWGADNRTLVYASERDGKWDLYRATIVRDEEKGFPNATVLREERLLPESKLERTCPQFSPDGKQLAFIEDRNRLMVVDLDSKKVHQVTDGSTWYGTGGGFDYRWSPDGRWFALEFIGNRHDPYSDIGLVSAEGGEITNLTRSGYFSSSPRWVLDGNAILFETDRYGMRAHASWGSLSDVMLVFLNQDAYDKFRLSKEDYELRKALEEEQKKAREKAEREKKAKEKGKKSDKEQEAAAKEKEETPAVEPIVVELEGIEDRIARLTPNSSNLASAIVDKKGETLYYLASFEKGFDLWKLDLRKRDPQLVSKNAGYGRFEMDGEGTIFLLGGQLRKLDGSNLKPVTFSARMKMDLAEERAVMFQHVYMQQKQRFYTEQMHGVDWEAMTANYRRFLPHIANNFDFAELLSEWLGELNVSHTGGRYSARGAVEATASLGLLFDWDYAGKGLMVAEVVAKGPFDHANSKVRKGVVIEKIDGEEVTPENDCSLLLNGKAHRKTLVSLYDPESRERWEEVVLPITSGAFSDLLYTRWVKQRAADVDRWSNGRLGYVHIRSMGDESFRDIYSDILGRYNDRDGIVIDTRFNGGGRLHEDIEVLFSGRKYVTQVIRGREACDMPSRRWNKPSIMLQCEANYSNAHGTPWVYKHQGLGKLVGAPVPGTMTSVSWETLQDPSLVFGIPIIGYRLPDGSYLENKQLDPDILVLNAPETVVQGEDTQLRTAVEELLKEIDSVK